MNSVSSASSNPAASQSTLGKNIPMIKGLTFLMFTMFAMTTDSVGVIIPEIIKEFRLTMTQAGAFHYATMTAIALAGIFLGYLAERSIQ